MIKRKIGLFSHFEELLSCFVFVFMLGLTFVNVIFRYCFSASISFTEEITCALFVLLCMLGAAIAAKHQTHLGLSVITERLKEKPRLFMAVIANILGVVFSLFLLFTGIKMTYNEYVLKQISISLQWPEWIYGSFLPIGSFFMAIRFGQSALSCIRAMKAVVSQ